MPFTPRTRLVNPRLGTYFGIFASAFTALVLLLLIFEQLGLSSGVLRLLMFAVPLALYAAIGIAARSDEPAEYFASGRRVPAFFTGLGLAVSSGGATLLVAGAGLFFFNGFDAWAVMLGYVAGFVAMAVLVAPYYRKFGCYTVPSYLGRRFESPLLRLAAAAMLAVPLLLVIAAEMRMTLTAATWLTGASTRAMGVLIVVALVATVMLGGMRSLSWSGTAQAIVAFLALLLPATVLAVTLTNLPLPQVSYGSVIRTLGRQEWSQGLPRPILSPLAFDLAGARFEPVARQFSVPFGSLGPVSYMLTSLTVMAGVATAPWLLPRTAATPGVYDARKSLGWAVVLFGVAMLTLSGVAVFMREFLMDQLAGVETAKLPGWFQVLVDIGFARVEGRTPRLAVPAFRFNRDAILFSLPIAAGYSRVIVDLALAGAVAAGLAGAAAATVALASIIAEDAVGGLGAEPASDRVRVVLGRAAVAGVALAGAFIAIALPFDPLRLLLWALALSASTGFGVIVLSIWWKRINAWGALVGATTGFAVAVLAILAGEAAWFGVHSALSGVFGVPASLIGAIVATRLTPAPDRPVLEMVRDLRVPGGETIHDREMRLLRLKQRQRT